jgi:hypothetical protein
MSTKTTRAARKAEAKATYERYGAYRAALPRTYVTYTIYLGDPADVQAGLEEYDVLAPRFGTVAQITAALIADPEFVDLYTAPRPDFAVLGIVDLSNGEVVLNLAQRPARCTHGGDYVTRPVDIDQHLLPVCVGCGEPIDL